MHIGWSRIWKVLLGCACAVGSIVLLACGLVGWGIAALEAAALLLALQYAPRAAQLWKTWWFVELVLVLAATVGYAAKIKDENLVTFDSAAQAQAACYAPCGACKP